MSNFLKTKIEKTKSLSFMEKNIQGHVQFVASQIDYVSSMDCERTLEFEPLSGHILSE